MIDKGNLSGGSWTAGLPLSNMQFRQIGRVARSADASLESTQFVIDFLQDTTIQIAALVNHTVSFGGKWAVEAANNIEFTDVVYSAEGDAWSAVAGAEWVLDELEWESDNFWLGTYSLDEIEGLTPLAFHILPSPVNARYWRVRVFDTSNADGYVDIGRPFLGPAWSPGYSYEVGASFGYEDPTTVVTSLGGAEYFDERDSYRVMRFTLPLLDPADEGFAKALEITRRAGISGEILAIPDPDDIANGQRRNFMGRLRQLNPLEQIRYDMSSMSFEIKEIK